MKTDPRPIPLSVVGPLTYTLPGSLDGLTVTSVEGGTVTREGSALAAGAVLYGGDVLTFTPTAEGGTTTLNGEQPDQEFSGDYGDLGGKPNLAALEGRVTALEDPAPVSLRSGTQEAPVPRTPAATGTNGGAYGAALYLRVVPEQNMTLVGLLDHLPHAASTFGVRAVCWDAVTQEPVGVSDVLTPEQRTPPSVYRFGTPAALLAGREYRVGIYTWGTNNVLSSQGAGTVAFDGFSVLGVVLSAPDTYPATAAPNTIPSFDLLTVQSVQKGVSGPLDPVDVPLITAVEGLPPGGTALLDDGTSPRLVHRRADGSLWYGAPFTAAP